MSSLLYIDCHTHNDLSGRADVLWVKNVQIQNSAKGIHGDELISIGLHPWDSGEVLFDEALFLRSAASRQVVAIGECGLDRLRGADIGIQTGLFIRQARIADDLGKPLIIHCVRAWQEIIELKAQLSPRVPWIIHGYRGKTRVAEQLIVAGFYLSFGATILSGNSILSGILRNIPDIRLLLETDDGGHPIEEIYLAAAEIKNISLIELQILIKRNFETVFRIHGTSALASKD